jgi:hypothetical protein
VLGAFEFKMGGGSKNKGRMEQDFEKALRSQGHFTLELEGL